MSLVSSKCVIMQIQVRAIVVEVNYQTKKHLQGKIERRKQQTNEVLVLKTVDHLPGIHTNFKNYPLLSKFYCVIC